MRFSLVLPFLSIGTNLVVSSGSRLHSGNTWTGPKFGFEMVCIKASTFRMGSPGMKEYGDTDEDP